MFVCFSFHRAIAEALDLTSNRDVYWYWIGHHVPETNWQYIDGTDGTQHWIPGTPAGHGNCSGILVNDGHEHHLLLADNMCSIAIYSICEYQCSKGMRIYKPGM